LEIHVEIGENWRVEIMRVLLMVIFAAIAIAGCVVGVFAHIASIVGSDVGLLGGRSWVLHISTMLVMLAAMLACRAHPAVATPAYWPRWVRILYTSVFVYATVNFLFISLSHTPEGRLERRDDGVWTIMNGSRLVREVSASEACAIALRGVRAKSGIWILFNGLGAATLLACARRRRENPIDNGDAYAERETAV
jgi:hypothetical protein